MTLIVKADLIPLKTDTEGVVRIGQTRITLDTVITAFLEGATVEEIVEQYPSLSLADTYSIIGYYLHHQEDVNHYIQERQIKHDILQKETEIRFNPVGIRERLLARKKLK